MTSKREKRILIIVVSIIILLIICLLTFIALSVVENTLLYKREDGNNSISANITNIDDLAYISCGDNYSSICKYDGVNKNEIIESLGSNDTISWSVSKYDMNGNKLGAIDELDTYSGRYTSMYASVNLSENYLSILRRGNKDINPGMYMLNIIDVETMTVKGEIEIEFEYNVIINFCGGYLHSISDNELTLYTYESGEENHSNVIKELVVDINEMKVIEFKELTTILAHKRFVIDNIPYSLYKDGSTSIYKYDNNFNVIDQIELGDYHLSSITPDGMLFTTKLSGSKEETEVKVYNKDLELHDEYKLGLWCSNVKMVNDSYIDCYRKSNEGRFSVMLSKFAMLPPTYHYDTKTVRIEEYKIA